MSKTSNELYNLMKKRRSVRLFSDEEIDIEEIKDAIMIASTAPSGANKQPYTFSIVIDNALKQDIRERCEAIEQDFYNHRITSEWKQDLSHLNVDYNKPFLSQAPCLIVVFKEMYKKENDEIHKNYYVQESIGIALGFLIQSLHLLGYQSLTYTPSGMSFLQELFHAPQGVYPVMILAVGKADKDYVYPKLSKKKFEEFAEIL